MFKILVPVNGSKCSLKAVDEAIGAAKERHDVVIQLINVQPMLNRHIARFTSGAQREIIRNERARQALGTALQRVRRAGVRCTAHMLRGRIVHSIVTYADRESVDQIVVGTSPARGLGRFLRAPIADGLIKASAIPVNVVRGGGAGMLERYGVPAGVGLGLTMMWLASE